MTPEGKFIAGCILLPCVIIIGPLYALALIYAWPVVLPLSGLLAYSIWRWNEGAKKRAAQFPNEMLAAQAEVYMQQANYPYLEPRIGGHGFMLPGTAGYVAGQAWEGPPIRGSGWTARNYDDGPTSLDDDEMI